MEKEKKQIAKIAVFITSIFIIFLSVTYAFINLQLVGSKKQVITAGVLDLELDEDNNNLTITDALPMYDEVGMIQEPFTFRLINNVSTPTNYILKLVDITTGDKLPTDVVKYGLTKNGVGEPKLLSTLSSDGTIDSGVIGDKETIEYTLRLWIDSSVKDNSVISGKSLSYRVDVVVSQSGANEFAGLNNDGFYYEKKYSAYNGSTLPDNGDANGDGLLDSNGYPVGELSFIFHQDGTCSLLANNQLYQTFQWQYENNAISIPALGVTGTFRSNGSELYVNEMGITLIIGRVSIVEEDYTYMFYTKDKKWIVRVNDRTKTSYGELKGIIDGYPVSLWSTFTDCINLTTPPEIPEGVIDMTQTFRNCTSLTTVPEIPESVKYMDRTFVNCTKLTGTIIVNANPESYESCFYGTTLPITLTGSSSNDTKIALASTSKSGNISY